MELNETIIFHIYRLEPYNPLPYLNAAHVYQQLNQPQHARTHLMKALEIDSTLALIYVDIAQAKMNERRYKMANFTSTKAVLDESTSTINSHSTLEILEMATSLARHASELIDI